MEYDVKPLGRRIYVRLEPVQETTSRGGIIIQDKHSEYTRVGTVLAIGARITEPIKVGDLILISFGAGTVIDGAGDFMAYNDCFRILSEDEVLIILSPKEPSK